LYCPVYPVIVTIKIPRRSLLNLLRRVTPLPQRKNPFVELTPEAMTRL
jgi:hypothetical protein